MEYVVCGVCKYCLKEQPKLNLFCISCDNRDWCREKSQKLEN